MISRSVNSDVALPQKVICSVSMLTLNVKSDGDSESNAVWPLTQATQFMDL